MKGKAQPSVRATREMAQKAYTQIVNMWAFKFGFISNIFLNIEDKSEDDWIFQKFIHIFSHKITKTFNIVKYL